MLHSLDALARVLAPVQQHLLVELQIPPSIADRVALGGGDSLHLQNTPHTKGAARIVMSSQLAPMIWHGDCAQFHGYAAGVAPDRIVHV